MTVTSGRAGLAASLAERLGCAKRRWATVEEAAGHIASLIAAGKHRPDLGQLNAYPCPRCRGVHVGHVVSARSHAARKKP